MTAVAELVDVITEVPGHRKRNMMSMNRVSMEGFLAMCPNGKIARASKRFNRSPLEGWYAGAML